MLGTRLGFVGWGCLGGGRLPAGVHLAGGGRCCRPAVALVVSVVAGSCCSCIDGNGAAAWVGAVWFSADWVFSGVGLRPEGWLTDSSADLWWGCN